MTRITTFSALRRLALLAVAASGAIACDSPTGVPGTTPPGQVPVASIEITTPPAELVVGQSITLEARLRAADGSVLQRPVAWSSNDTAVATVTPAGVLTARTGGSVRITARSEARQTSVTIGIRAPVTIAGIEILGPGADLIVGQTFALTATVRGSDGSVLPVAVSWSSSDTTRATVTAAGLLTARAAGSVRVTASAGEREATREIEVRSAPAFVTELLPASVPAGSPGFELRIRGTGFQPGATVMWAGQARAARVVSPSEIRIDIAAADVAHAGGAEVRVLNPGQTLSSQPFFFMIERVPATRVYDLRGLAWAEGGLPVDIAQLYLGGDIRQSAVQSVTAGVLRIHERASGPDEWDLTLTIVTRLQSGEIHRQDDYVFFGQVTYPSPEGRMTLQLSLFPDVSLRTLTTHDGDVIVWQSLHPTGDPIHEKAWRYSPR